MQRDTATLEDLASDARGSPIDLVAPHRFLINLGTPSRGLRTAATLPYTPLHTAAHRPTATRRSPVAVLSPQPLQRRGIACPAEPPANPPEDFEPVEEELAEGETLEMHLTDAAIKQIERAQQAAKDDKLALRLAVESGGCHGYQYKMQVTSKREDDDYLFRPPTDTHAALIVDSASLPLVKGSTIDYSTELIGSAFKIRNNPQSKDAGMGIDVYCFVHPPPAALICPICTDIASSPVEVCDESHILCDSCYEDLVKSHRNDGNQSKKRPRCPTCRGRTKEASDYSGSSSLVSVVAHTLLEGSVKCGVSDYGCSWTGTYDDLFKHVKKCPLNAFPCRHSKLGCDASLRSHELAVHTASCPILQNTPADLLSDLAAIVRRIDRDSLAKHERRKHKSYERYLQALRDACKRREEELGGTKEAGRAEWTVVGPEQRMSLGAGETSLTGGSGRCGRKERNAKRRRTNQDRSCITPPSPLPRLLPTRALCTAHRTAMADASLQAVVEALNVLYTNPDREAKEKANAWLGEFQKSNEAWATAQMILFAPDAPLEPKLFAAQTFRTKVGGLAHLERRRAHEYSLQITYDLATLPQEQLIPLRDSLLAALRSFASGPRVVLTQICIALADIALQLTKAQWDDPVASMIDMFGKEPAMAAALLEFFQVLAEEYNSNYKINVNNDFGREGDATVKRGEQVIGLLSMYVQAPGITAGLHNQCFATLGAWLRTGQIRAGSLAGTPILASAFSSLSNDQLFDNAVDVLVDIIHETQELQENIAIIQEIMPRLTALGANLANEDTREDEDKMRGYCRIFVEAGEWYEPLIVQHPDTFLPLVELIKQCAAYEGLDVVGITLNFWYRLSQGVHRAGPNPSMAPLLQVFADLVGIVIRHLHFPDDSTPLTGEERDTFRDFRHKIGDTLKDCCKVLGAGPCLQQAYDVIAQAVAAGDAVRWQDVEAPLFSMRSMGAMIDVHDNELVPKIMELLPKLPQHPRIRYAAILVIGRYTHWTQQHPDLIQFQLPYVSAGFDDTDPEVLAAASQTMKYLCKDCPEHLVAFLPQLHTFIQTVSSKLKGEDLLDLSAAIAHILIAMPPSQIPSALSTFLMPNVEIVHALVSQDAPAAKDQIRKAVEALERIDVYLAIIGQVPDGLPDSCIATCQQVWSVMDALIAKYGSNPAVADRATIAVRRGLAFFDDMAFAVAPAILDRLSSAFEQTPASGYLWITGKVVQQFAPKLDPAFDAVVKSAFERESNKVFELLQSTPPSQIPDVLDDYVHLVQTLIESAPQNIFTSPAFPAAFQCTLTALTLPSPRIVLAALDAVRAVVGHDSLHPESNGSFASPSQQAAFPTYATAIRAIIESTATQLMQLLLDVLVGGGEDEPYNVLTILRLLSIQFPTVLAQTIPAAVELLPARAAGPADKAEFLAKFNGAITAQNPNQVKEAFTWLLRASRRSRDRARGEYEVPTGGSEDGQEEYWFAVCEKLEECNRSRSVVVVAIHLASAHPSAALLPLDTSQARPQRLDSVARAQNMCEECCTAIAKAPTGHAARCATPAPHAARARTPASTISGNKNRRRHPSDRAEKLELRREEEERRGRMGRVGWKCPGRRGLDVLERDTVHLPRLFWSGSLRLCDPRHRRIALLSTVLRQKTLPALLGGEGRRTGGRRTIPTVSRQDNPRTNSLLHLPSNDLVLASQRGSERLPTWKDLCGKFLASLSQINSPLAQTSSAHSPHPPHATSQLAMTRSSHHHKEVPHNLRSNYMPLKKEGSGRANWGSDHDDIVEGIALARSDDWISHSPADPTRLPKPRTPLLPPPLEFAPTPDEALSIELEEKSSSTIPVKMILRPRGEADHPAAWVAGSNIKNWIAEQPPVAIFVLTLVASILALYVLLSTIWRCVRACRSRNPTTQPGGSRWQRLEEGAEARDAPPPGLWAPMSAITGSRYPAPGTAGYRPTRTGGTTEMKAEAHTMSGVFAPYDPPTVQQQREYSPSPHYPASFSDATFGGFSVAATEDAKVHDIAKNLPAHSPSIHHSRSSMTKEADLFLPQAPLPPQTPSFASSSVPQMSFSTLEGTPLPFPGAPASVVASPSVAANVVGESTFSTPKSTPPLPTTTTSTASPSRPAFPTHRRGTSSSGTGSFSAKPLALSSSASISSVPAEAPKVDLKRTWSIGTAAWMPSLRKAESRASGAGEEGEEQEKAGLIGGSS
ncbi:hypothetical protein OF846_000989 [Rhodotorula toruloides]|nr:hypothetical protein OF846_000989 [Rhodotorula toruloides]